MARQPYKVTEDSTRSYSLTTRERDCLQVGRQVLSRGPTHDNAPLSPGQLQSNCLAGLLGSTKYDDRLALAHYLLSESRTEVWVLVQK